MSKLSLVVLAAATLAVLPGCLGMNTTNTSTGDVMTSSGMNTGTEVTIETPVVPATPEVMTGTDTTTMTGTDTTTMTGTDTMTGTMMMTGTDTMTTGTAN